MPNVKFDDFIESIKFKENFEEYEFIESTFEGTTKLMNIKHLVCGEIFPMIPKNFRNGQRCPHCAAIKRKISNIKPLDKNTEIKIKELDIKILDYKGKTKKNLFQCNKCKEKFEMTLSELLNKECPCPECEVSKVSKINKNIDKYNNEISKFNFEIVPEYFHSTIKKSKFRCTKCGKKKNSYYFNIKRGTVKCDCEKDKYLSLDISYYKNKLKELNLDKEYEIIEDTYINSITKCKFKHLICGKEFDKTPTDFFSNNQHCTKCCKLSITSEELNNLLNETSLKLITNINLYDITLDTELEFQCTKCGEKIKNSIKNIKRNLNSCYCSRKTSKGEEKINNYLIKNNYIFERQKIFKDLSYQRHLKFDFYIESLNLCIEYDGEQHFKPIDAFGGEAEFIENLKRDKLKNDYCDKNNINLLRINFTQIDIINNILENYLKTI